MDPHRYALKAKVEVPFDELLARMPEALQREGFGVLTEIDVQATLKKKLGLDFRRYRILGACRPPSAHRVLEADLDIGVLLPCNVVLYEDDGGTVIAAIDPIAAIAGVTDDPNVKEVAADVRERLQRVIDNLRGAAADAPAA